MSGMDVSTGWRVEVSWKRDETGPGENGTTGHVQLASVNPDSPFQFPDVSTQGHWEAGEEFDGWRVTLDADGIDKLIDKLQKAKRQAFPTTAPKDVAAIVTGGAT